LGDSKFRGGSGYHFHFLSDDRRGGGHLLQCSGKNLRIRFERLNDFHLSLPESEEFKQDVKYRFVIDMESLKSEVAA
ncbi:MAG TPA: acetolactate decarboxylase, partial [Chthoniobacterales bacterium]|nr:acetolactate decarboxylase [Chthoniobacterales bacterium]